MQTSNLIVLFSLIALPIAIITAPLAWARLRRVPALFHAFYLTAAILVSLAVIFTDRIPSGTPGRIVAATACAILYAATVAYGVFLLRSRSNLSARNKRELRRLLTLHGPGRVCKMQIPGGNGNPDNAGLECDCAHPFACRYGAKPKIPGTTPDGARLTKRKVFNDAPPDFEYVFDAGVTTVDEFEAAINACSCWRGGPCDCPASLSDS